MTNEMLVLCSFWSFCLLFSMNRMPATWPWGASFLNISLKFSSRQGGTTRLVPPTKVCSPPTSSQERRPLFLPAARFLEEDLRATHLTDHHWLKYTNSHYRGNVLFLGSWSIENSRCSKPPTSLPPPDSLRRSCEQSPCSSSRECWWRDILI